MRISRLRRVGKRSAKRILLSPLVCDLLFGFSRRLGTVRGTRNSPRVYSIGILRGTDPFHLNADSANPVLTAESVTDMDAGFVADPFVIRRSGAWWMFFEAWNNHARKGEIACAQSYDTATWNYVGRVLREPFHLSYPHVFDLEGAVYMIPEAFQSDSVPLYRATRFPDRWSRQATLVEGCYADATVFQAHGMWWMFASPNEFFASDELHLYYADSLLGPWRPHPANPIIRNDPLRARPAGRVLVSNERIIRFAQVCSPAYGTAVRAFEITRLTTREYGEIALSPDPLLAGSGTGWNADGMHHIDLAGDSNPLWACVDGWAWNHDVPR